MGANEWDNSVCTRLRDGKPCGRKVGAFRAELGCGDPLHDDERPDFLSDEHEGKATMTKFDRNSMSPLEIAVWAAAFDRRYERCRDKTALETADRTVIVLRQMQADETQAEWLSTAQALHTIKIRRRADNPSIIESIGCMCGARPPAGEQNPDEWLALHMAHVRAIDPNKLEAPLPTKAVPPIQDVKPQITRGVIDGYTFDVFATLYPEAAADWKSHQIEAGTTFSGDEVLFRRFGIDTFEAHENDPHSHRIWVRKRGAVVWQLTSDHYEAELAPDPLVCARCNEDIKHPNHIMDGFTKGIHAFVTPAINPSHPYALVIADDIRRGLTSDQIRDEIIAKVGMMASKRTPEMRARLAAALARERGPLPNSSSTSVCSYCKRAPGDPNATGRCPYC